MGTRGLLGVRIDGQDKLMYNHFDSYPDWLGEKVVADVRKLLSEVGLEGIKELARKVRLVKEDDQPTFDEVESFRKYRREGENGNDWYSYLRGLQGNLYGLLNAGVMTDSKEFIYDSLFCEWVYIVNLDEGVFEVYMGAQTSKHTKGRYHDGGSIPHAFGIAEYYPCALILTFKIEDIPQDWISQIPNKF